MRLYVRCEGYDGEVEGLVVEGNYDGDRRKEADVPDTEAWDLDGPLVVLTEEGERYRICGWLGSVVPISEPAWAAVAKDVSAPAL